MPEPVVLNEEDDSLLTSQISKPLYIQFARYVSTILSPAAVSIPFVLLVALHKANNTALALGHAFVALLFMSAGPLLYIFIGVKLGKFTDVDVSVRSQRVGPFIVGLGSTLLGLLLLAILNASRSLEVVLLIVLICGLIMMAITLWWKISIHASTLAGATTMLTVLYGNVMLPTFLLLALVCWSRVILHRHTTAQVVGGSLLSIVLSLVALSLLGMM
jgi:hypothetical protein